MFAAVDVGTNTFRLLLAEVKDGILLPVHYHRKITRLGGGYDPEKGLAPPAMERTLSALREIPGILRGKKVEKVCAVGTAALRKAPNGPRFIDLIRSTTGINLEIINGLEEARLSALGASAALKPNPRSCLIFDIGGGSTEFILWASDKAIIHKSYELGVVDLCENLPSATEQKKQIAEVMGEFKADMAGKGLLSLVAEPECILAGTAGTVTTLAAIKLGMKDYDWRRVNNLVLSLCELRSMLSRIENLTVPQRETLPGMEKGRGDLIVPGLRVVLGKLQEFEKEQLTVSDFGLLEGMILDMAGRSKQDNSAPE